MNCAPIAQRGAMAAFATIKDVTKRPLAHLILWLAPEQCARE